MKHPLIIQGGMGAGVSLWKLPRAVSLMGQLGVVSGTGVEFIFARQLQLGDPEGHLRRALKHFPAPAIAERVFNTYFVENGIPKKQPFKSPHRFAINPDQGLVEITIVANFCIMWLAKEGHNGAIGINLLEKIQLPHLFVLYGALLAGVDYVLVGAGIPTQFPRILDHLTQHEPASYKVHVVGAKPTDNFKVNFNPKSILGNPVATLKRPYLLPIISSTLLAKILMKAGRINGFVIEGPTAGGHNAPPRGHTKISSTSELVYGKKDEVDLAVIKSAGLPYWLAGSFNTPEKLDEARNLGAQGIQAGSIFALCEESGLDPIQKQTARRLGFRNALQIYTNSSASPTGFPFKEAVLPGSLTDPDVYQNRPRICDVGELRGIFLQENGELGYCCPAEPLGPYLSKGGKIGDTERRICLCNALLANIGLAQRRSNNTVEPPFVTLGSNLSFLPNLMDDENSWYTAKQAIDYLLST